MAKKATEFNRSLVVALAAAFVVIAVVAIIVYAPQTRTGRFHAGEQINPVSWSSGQYYDFDASPLATKGSDSPQDADIQLAVQAGTHTITAQNSAQILPVASPNVDCSALAVNAQSATIVKSGDVWPLSYFCVKSSQQKTALMLYQAQDSTQQGAQDGFGWYTLQGICGDGYVQAGEQCDDANAEDGDGCSGGCGSTEPGWNCQGVAPTICTTACGDGIRAGTEECDGSDLGSKACTDFVANVETNEHFTGGTLVCNTDCKFDFNKCTTGVPTPICGDGIKELPEECDDSNVMSGDGCSDQCLSEAPTDGPGSPCSPSGAAESYYDAATSTLGIGVCKAGQLICNGTPLRWSVKIPQALPEPEGCDGKDNDCNYFVDDYAIELVPGQGKVQINNGACNAIDKCGTPTVSCQGADRPRFSSPSCVLTDVSATETPEYKYVCDFECVSGYVRCGNECYSKDSGQCVSDVWTCAQNAALDTNINACVLEEACPRAGATQSCYSGPLSVRGVGACREGTRTCGSELKWGLCVGQVLPAEERCDGSDNDCNGLIDEMSGRGEGSICPGNTNCGSDKVDCTALQQVDGVSCISGSCKILSCELGYEDKDKKSENGCEAVATGCVDPDRDGYGAAGTELGPCPRSTTRSDCDSKSARINPNATETCDGADNNCNNAIDENILETRACGFGLCANGTQSRTCSSGNFSEWTLCTNYFLAQDETCNKIDDNCDGVIDESFDSDGDTFVANVTACLAAYNRSAVDCNDASATINPNAAELCNGVDDDCDGMIDDVGGGDTSSETGCACTGLTANRVATQKRAPEAINGVDDNCDGRLDAKETDNDADGFTPDDGDCNDRDDSVNPNAVELCYTDVDDNCDGQTNEGCPGFRNATTSGQRNVSVLEQAVGTVPPLEPTIVETPSEAPPTTEEGPPTTPEAGPGGEAPFEEIGAELSEEPKRSNTSLLVAIISLIAAAVGGSLWFVRMKMKANVATEAETFGIGMPEETPPEEAKSFISSAVSQGHTATNVKAALQEKGWSEEDIDGAMEETAKDIEKLGELADRHMLNPAQEKNLTKYVSNARKNGFTDEQIKAALINGGWTKEMIGKYL